MSPAAVVLGMLPQNLCPVPPLHLHVLNAVPTIAIKTLSKCRTHVCAAHSRRLMFQVQGYWLSLLMGRALSTIACTFSIIIGPKLHSLLHFSYPMCHRLCEGCIITRHSSCCSKQIVWSYIDIMYTVKRATGLIIVWPGYLSHSRGYFGALLHYKYCLS